MRAKLLQRFPCCVELLGLNDSLKERIENQQNQIRQAAEIPPDEDTKGTKMISDTRLKTLKHFEELLADAEQEGE